MSRILAPDSSPSASKLSKPAPGRSNGTSPNFDGVGFGRTQFEMTPASDCNEARSGPSNGSYRGRTLPDDDKAKGFKMALDNFRYAGPGAIQSEVIDLADEDFGDLSSLSDLSDLEHGRSKRGERVEEPPKKKRKFVLRKSGRSRSASLSSDVEMYEKGDLGTPGTSISSRENEKAKANGSNVHDEKLSMVQRLVAMRPQVSSERARRALAIAKGNLDAALRALDETPSERTRQVITIPESPASSSSSPAKPGLRASASPPVTKSLIKPKSRYITPPRSGVQVTTKIAKIVPTRRLSPEVITRKVQSMPVRSKALTRVREHMDSVRSTPTTDTGGSSSDEGSDGGYDAETKNERKALQWFNHNDEKQLIDVVGLTQEQAKTILELRPFRSTDDLTTKLNATKGVQPRMFYNCVDLMSGLQRIDTVLEKCEKMGDKLSLGVKKWSGEKNIDSEYLHEQPKGASAGVTLRNFQMYGVNWLNLLYRTRCSGILADDMGLGKTAQVITFLNHIVLKKDAGPHLVVVPSSVLTNWMREFAVFGPSLRVYKYHGPQKERVEQQHELRSARDDYDVILTTYDMASGGDRDHNFLRKYEFDAVIYDEGHILKNQKSVKYTKLMRIRTEWRLLLTGTPLQNNLGELISLLKFIMPAYFRGAEEALSQIFSVSQETQLSRERIKRAKQMMRPFVLRRKKIDVLDSLKKKTEVVKYCEMTTEQRKIYQDTFAKSRAALLDQKEQDAEGLETRSRTKGNKAQVVKSGHVLMELRKAANHPLLFRRLFDDRKVDSLARDYLKVAEHATEDVREKREDFMINSDAELCMSIAMQYPECAKHKLADKEWLNSGKIQALRDVISEAQAKGERLIVFSQFVQTLEIICRALEVFGISYRGFTGSTDVNSRQEIVDEFTRDESIVCFLLSTRAGGVGINLTAANWVVLYDQDFNPQNDQQAADRCYRMGQEREVTVVRLISRGTIDEHIYTLGRSKLQLADRVQTDNDVEEDDATSEDQGDVEKKVEQSLLAGLLADQTDGGNGEGMLKDAEANSIAT